MKSLIQKDKLTEILKANRALHKEMFDAAQEKYLVKVGEALQTVSNEFYSKKKLNLGPIHNIVEPQSYVSEYDAVLDMLEYTTEEVITLEGKEFQQYVKDKWHWGRSFVQSSGAYLGGYGAGRFGAKIESMSE